MNFAAAINIQLINEISVFCNISIERAKVELKLARITAKTMGLDIASALHFLGLVS